MIFIDVFGLNKDIEKLSVKAETILENILTPIYVWYDEGENDGVRFGHSVSTAGDINGDDFTDAIVGSPNYKIEGITPGAAFVYLGGFNGLNDNYLHFLTPMQHGYNFGISVSHAGDINNDGFDDVIVGADNYQVQGETGAYGAAYIYYGSPTGLDEINYEVIVGPQKASQFGFTVSGVGDVNGDEHDDVVIGAISYSNGQKNEGSVYLYLGSEEGIALTPFWQFENNNATSQLGYAISGLGDLNQDGYDDFSISAPFYDYDENLINNGAVYVFLGSEFGPNAEPDWGETGSEPNEYFGFSIACAGDVINNGYNDLIIGANKLSAAYIFFNSAGELGTEPGWSITSDQTNSGFGYSVAGLGDVNNDGFADIAIGAPYYMDDQPEEGAVFVFCGSNMGLNPTECWKTFGDKAETEYGFSISFAGDLNNDNRNDLLIGSPSYRRDSKTKMGRAYSYHGMSSEDVFYFYTFLPLVKR
jgi:hypothetical protein